MTMYSKYNHHSTRLNGQRNWGESYDHLTNMNIFTLSYELEFHMSSKNVKKATTTLFNCATQLVLIVCFLS